MNIRAMLGSRSLARLAGQLGRPTGLAGMFWSRMMIRWNQQGNDLALRALDIQATDRVVEVGFGPGAALGRAAERAYLGRVAGIDISPDMVRAARRRHRALIDAGRMELGCASMARIPYPDGSFDKLFLVATLYFLGEPEECFAEARRVLVPGGRIAVVFVLREDFMKGLPMPVRFYTHDELAGMLVACGFRDLETTRGGTMYCMAARA